MGAFKINQAWIAKNTCENRYRPQMNCNGNCVLMKKLKQQEKEEQNAPATLKMDVSTVVISSRSFFATFSPLSFYIAKPFSPVFHSGKPVDMCFSFFHPPQYS